MNKLHIDFETRSELDIKKVGAYKYSKHPSTEILCMAYAWNRGPVQLIKYKENMNTLNTHLSLVIFGKTVLTSFNAYFERCIFRFVIPRMRIMDGRFNLIWEPKYWQCTMAKSSVCGLTGNLDTVCQLLGMKEHKDPAGKRVMMKMCKPRKPRKAELETLKPGQILWHETPEDFEALYKYCKQDVEVERGIDRRLPRISDSEQALWQIDQRINDTGIAVDMPRVNKAIALMNDAKKKADTKIKYMTEFRVGAITQVAKIKAELGRYGVYPDSLDAAHIDELLGTDIPEKAKDILLLRKNNGKSSTAKYEAIRSRHCEGRVHGLFSYHLATTGRWGSYGIQLHNLPRGSIKDINTARFSFDADAFWMYPPMSSLLSTLIRTMFIPMEKSDFMAADYKAIEARVLNWLARQHDFVQMYADGVDTYVHMAKIIYNTEHIDEDKRFVGKQTELGCIAFGTKTLTHRGWKSIENVLISDKLWDGVKWVKHRGVILKGEKRCINVQGVWLTPEHEILTKDGWTTAQELSITNQKLGMYMGNSKLCQLDMENVGGLSPSNVVAPVVEHLLHQETTWSKENLHAVIAVLKKHPVKLRVIAHGLRNHINQDFLIEFVQSLAGVKLNLKKTMVNGESKYILLGSKIESVFLNTWLYYQGMMIQNSTLTGLTMMGDMNLVISDSQPDGRIFKTADIQDSGDYHRFQINSMVVSNSGYGMGSDRFQTQVSGYGVDLPSELCEKAIKSYRKSHPKVVKFWYATEAMVKNAIRNPGTVYHCNGIFAKVSKSFLKLKLLSGRLLYYFRPEIDEDKSIRFWGYDSQRHQVYKQYTYGAKMVENIVQATARDILAHALVTLEGSKYKTVLHVHDEVVSEVAEGEGDIDEYCNLVASLPGWASGCPTKAEGWVGKYYKKD